MQNWKLIAGWSGLALVLALLDQLSKYLVVQQLRLGEEIVVWPMFSWVRLHNSGAAFSMLAGAGGWQRWFFVLIALAFTAFLFYELRRLQPGQWLHGLAYALILGGAWGNLYDRVLHGYVVDFVLVHFRREYFFPAFNLADAAITLGAMLWIWLLLKESWHSWRQQRGAAGSQG